MRELEKAQKDWQRAERDYLLATLAFRDGKVNSDKVDRAKDKMLAAQKKLKAVTLATVTGKVSCLRCHSWIAWSEGYGARCFRCNPLPGHYDYLCEKCGECCEDTCQMDSCNDCYDSDCPCREPLD